MVVVLWGKTDGGLSDRRCSSMSGEGLRRLRWGVWRARCRGNDDGVVMGRIMTMNGVLTDGDDDDNDDGDRPSVLW